jgi:hypothetical protein
VQLLQASALFRLYDPLILQRLQDNEIRFPKGETKFTMAEMFESLRTSIWAEVTNGININSFRRELQRMHLFILSRMLISEPSIIPHDAITLARHDFELLNNQIEQRLAQESGDVYSIAHLREAQAKIEAALNAQIQKSF